MYFFYINNTAKGSTSLMLNTLLPLYTFFLVVTCQRYVCHNVIPLTMTVLINHCITNNELY